MSRRLKALLFACRETQNTKIIHIFFVYLFINGVIFLSIAQLVVSTLFALWLPTDKLVVQKKRFDF